MSGVQKLTLGKVGAVYGIKGWLKIHSFTDDPEAIFDYAPWSLNLGEKSQSANVTDWRRHNNGLIAKVAGIDDRDQAQSLLVLKYQYAQKNYQNCRKVSFTGKT